MNGNKKTSATWNISNFLHSDLLPYLAGLIEAFPDARTLFPEILRLRVVIDANIVQGELRWRLKSRRKPGARSALHEVLACGVLIGYAPHFLDGEIREHARRIATETNAAIADVYREWKDFRRYLCFYTAQEKSKTDVSSMDPDDIAYIDTLDEIAARAIYTHDRDYLRTRTPVILVSIDTTLQQYARASAVRIGIAIGSSFSVVFGLRALLALGRLLASLLRAVKRLSPAAQVLIVGAITALLAHPKSRARLFRLWELLNRSLRPAVWEAVVECLYQFMDATSTADNTFQALQKVLPPLRRYPLLLHARSVCLAARRPLSLDEIVKGVLANGYRPRSKTPHNYLLRKLRSDDRFEEIEAGWVIRGTNS